MVIETMPDFVDRIIVVNDKSTDNTAKIVENLILKNTIDTIKIKSVYDSVKPSRYNRANLVLLEMQKKELDIFPLSEVYNTNIETEYPFQLSLRRQCYGNN